MTLKILNKKKRSNSKYLLEKTFPFLVTNRASNRQNLPITIASKFLLDDFDCPFGWQSDWPIELVIEAINQL